MYVDNLVEAGYLNDLHNGIGQRTHGKLYLFALERLGDEQNRAQPGTTDVGQVLEIQNNGLTVARTLGFLIQIFLELLCVYAVDAARHADYKCSLEFFSL